MEDWAEIRRLHKVEDLGIKTIARRLGLARNTVRAALSADDPPKYVRPDRGSLTDAVEPQIRRLLVDTPTMPATMIAERIGWTYITAAASQAALALKFPDGIRASGPARRSEWIYDTRVAPKQRQHIQAHSPARTRQRPSGRTQIWTRIWARFWAATETQAVAGTENEMSDTHWYSIKRGTDHE